MMLFANLVREEINFNDKNFINYKKKLHLVSNKINKWHECLK